MVETEGWTDVVKPLLDAKLRESFPDPLQFTSEEEFVYAAKVASVFKKVVAELLQIVENHVLAAKHLEEKKKGLVSDPFRIGQE